jgi:hypothetical protein
MLSLPKSYNRHCGKMLTITSVLLVLLLAIAIAPSGTLAQDNGSNKLNDPTGAWLIRNSEGAFILTVFHKGGTLTGDLQGESAFVPGVKPPANVIISPESGVWQKTGGKTFAATFITMEYDPNPPFALFEFDKILFTGVLSDSGDQMELTALVTLFDPNGKQLPPRKASPTKLTACAFRWKYCQTSLTPCPFPRSPQRPRPNKGPVKADSGWPRARRK